MVDANSGTSEQRFPVYLCRRCLHPGGQHRYSSGMWMNGPCPCRLCDCEDWIENGPGYWSHMQTKELEEKARAS